MRVVPADGYAETRDALAHDWSRFLKIALPSVSWLPIPNLGTAVVEYVRDWDLDGFIFSGGNSLGEAPLRDKTETAILREALATSQPVIGVCRGLQFFQQYLGGRVGACPRETHVGREHPVCFVRALGEELLPWASRRVNSFHTMGVRPEELADGLELFALSSDGWVEGVVHANAPMMAVQWHPERVASPEPKDIEMFRTLFGEERLACAR